MAKFSEETKAEIERVAKARGIEPAALLAVCTVESGGRAFAVVDNRREPLIRFEGHYFDRLLSGVGRSKARLRGLSSPRAGAVKNPRSQAGRWALLHRARAIDDAAALQSCSWGIGQVMGAHWRALGYSSPQALVREARAGVSGQVMLMVRFIEKNGLLPLLHSHNWAAFARRYNGPAYKKNRYDEKLAAAYARYRHPTKHGEVRVVNGDLRRGMRGASVKDLQRHLLAAGYPLKVDGVFGPETEAVTKRFQCDRALHVDGIFGPRTQKELRLALARKGRESGWISVLMHCLSHIPALVGALSQLRRWTR
ncbi:MAG: N-acetylmuramidase domain-containing protein [Pseudomonadota bacterium]